MSKKNQKKRKTCQTYVYSGHALSYTKLVHRHATETESRILAGYYGLNKNISFTFQAIKNLFAHPTYLCLGPFCKFFGDF